MRLGFWKRTSTRVILLCVIVIGGLSLSASFAGSGSAAGATNCDSNFPFLNRFDKQPLMAPLFVIIARSDSSEPRFQIRSYDSTPFFGQNIDGLKPGQTAVVDDTAYGYPIEHFADLPAGDYFVQGTLNVYTTFNRADGHTVKMHMDQWEGQHFQRSPGNLYSAVQKVHLDPAVGSTVKISLDKIIPPIAVPADTEHVKHVKFESPLLSKFWGQPIYIGATILLPKDYDKNPKMMYPVNYEQGHFSTGNPARFTESGNGQAAANNRQRANSGAFSDAWLSDKYPRMMFVTFQHPTPYYDDSYAVDSPNWDLMERH